MKPSVRPKIKQPTSDELLDSLLGFLRSKFYDGHGIAFNKDRKRLLKWVVLFPAAWLTNRGVTLPGDRYANLFKKIVIEAFAHARVDEIKYLPAWLRMVVQSHFKHHGDEIYEEAKQLRTLADQAMSVLQKLPVRNAELDPVKELADARKLITLIRGKKRVVAPAKKDQLSLF